ncbi:MAG: hypothetical protein EHM47_09215 [Ignavibacteriales bacterium]|nr:MAG: hypothetical protein EHM47_09215 [Ignavibacteriales bacterium]
MNIRVLLHLFYLLSSYKKVLKKILQVSFIFQNISDK